MTWPTGSIAWGGGALTLRLEQPPDAAALERLAFDRVAPMLRLTGLPEIEVRRLADIQHRARAQAYRGQFPQGRNWIVEVDGVFAGRLLEADEACGVYIVDVALLPERRGRGLGRALVAALQAAQASRGAGVRARAALDNVASRALFASLGFAQAAGGQAGVDVELVWAPPRD